MYLNQVKDKILAGVIAEECADLATDSRMRSILQSTFINIKAVVTPIRNRRSR